jgi:hypothetical protein
VRHWRARRSVWAVGFGVVRLVDHADVHGCGERRARFSDSIRGGITLLNMMLGDITPGGTGSGLYGILILAVVSVFVAGLMVGRTPEYLRKKTRPARSSSPRCTS